MSRQSNWAIPAEWARNQAAQSHTGNFWTNGKELYSYSLIIGDTMSDGTKVLRDHTAGGKWPYYSQTTSCHIGRARMYADIVD